MNSLWQRELIRLFHKAPVSRLFGMTLSYDEQAHPHIILPYNPNLDHAFKGIHGGVIASLLDNAGIFAVLGQKEGVFFATSEFKTHLLYPARECDLHAEGRVVKSGKNVSVAEMRVKASSGELIAIGTGTYVALGDAAVGTVTGNTL